MIFSEEQLLRAYDSAPAAIQHALIEGKAIDFMVGITDRYTIHIDTAGKVTESIRNMLLGLSSPDDFIPELQNIGLQESVARQLASDLNKEVFIPLRDEVRKNPAPSSSNVVSAPTNPQVPIMRVHEEPVISDSIPSATVVETTPIQETPVYNLIQPEAATTPHVRTMASDIDLLTHPEKIETGTQEMVTPQTPHPWQTSPAQSFQTASVPYTSMPAESRAIPAPLPLQIPAAWTPPHVEGTNTSNPIESVRQIENNTPASTPIIKSYGTDPYRESI